jgi:hypothetical protein
MSELVMNIKTCVTYNTTYTMLYVRFNDECTHMCYW